MKRNRTCYHTIQSWLKDPIRRPFLYRYQRDRYKLGLITLIAVFIVIRGSTAPLLIDNRIMRFLFCTDEHGDKTMYNIGISVIAAFIFYIFQVYFPERSMNKKKMSHVSHANQHEIFILEQFILSWHVFLSIRDGQHCCEYREFSYKTSKDDHSVWKELYEETMDELIDDLDRIIDSDLFKELNVSYCEFILKARTTIWWQLKLLKDILPMWETYPMKLEKYEYELIQNLLSVFTTISQKLQSIERVTYTPTHVYAYGGKSELQKLAEKL